MRPIVTVLPLQCGLPVCLLVTSVNYAKTVEPIEMMLSVNFLGLKKACTGIR